jgi:hypothetical protein
MKGGIADIMTGFNREVHRWKLGSLLKWAAWRSGFNSQDNANYAAIHLAQAAGIWDQADVRVTFE